ncbi:MAG: 50S ribosomal protein L11 methyltransferase [Candidatus Curtissbacteria bacterium]|nr:50S ribosomal protein L11 methyltransferase [Candidatus Curtissbacteria bacterium]
MEVIAALILIVVIFALLFVILSSFLFMFDLFLDLPYVATDKKKIETIMKFADLKKNQTAIDLGSGDGRLLLASAKKGAAAIGYELNPFLIAITKIRAKAKGASAQIIVKRSDLWKADLKIADVVFVYGRKRTMQKFEDFVYKNSKKGTRIIVNTNQFPSNQPIKSENNIFLYIK